MPVISAPIKLKSEDSKLEDNPSYVTVQNHPGLNHEPCLSKMKIKYDRQNTDSCF